MYLVLRKWDKEKSVIGTTYQDKSQLTFIYNLSMEYRDSIFCTVVEQDLTSC